MPNNTKTLTRGKAIIRARDGAASTITITADDGVVSDVSGDIKRSSGSGYDVKLTTPFRTAFADTPSVKSRLDNPYNVQLYPAPTTYDTQIPLNFLFYTYTFVEALAPTYLDVPTEETEVYAAYASTYLVTETGGVVSEWFNALDPLSTVTISSWTGTPDIDLENGFIRFDRTEPTWATLGTASTFTSPTSTGNFTLGIGLEILSVGAVESTVFASIFQSNGAGRGVFLGIVDEGTHDTLRFRAYDGTGAELYTLDYPFPDSTYPKDLDIFITGNANTARMYINGVEEASDTIALEAGDHDFPLHIGRLTSTTGAYLDAEVRGLLLLNTGITPSEVEEWGFWFRGQKPPLYLGDELLVLDTMALDQTGGEVIRWEDATPNNNDFVREPGLSPLYLSNAGDESPAVLFSTSRMNGPVNLVAERDAFTVIAYVQALSTDSNQKAIFMASTGTSESLTRLGLFQQNTVVNAAARRLDTDGSVQITTGAGAVVVGEWKIFAVDVNWQTRTMRLYDGTTVVASSSAVGSSAGATPATNSMTVTVGMSTGSPRYLNANVRTLLCYDRILTTQEMEDVQDMIIQRYAPKGLNAYPELTLWMDATEINTLYADTSGTTNVTTNGDLIARWDNRLGAGNLIGFFSNPTPAAQVLYRPSGINGLPSVEFEIGRKLLGSGVTEAATSWTVLAVLTQDQVDAFGKYLLDFSNTRLIFQIDYVNTAGDGPAYFEGTHRRSESPNPLNTPFVLAFRLNAATGFGEIYRDGALLATLVYDPVSLSNANVGFGGHYINPDVEHNGLVGEVGMFRRAITDFELAKTINLMKRKWLFARTEEELSTPVAWWHVDDLEALFNDGDRVGTWTDRINAVDLVQADNLRRPVWDEVRGTLEFSKNGLYWMSFNDIAPLLSSTGVATFMIVYRQYDVNAQSAIFGNFPASPSSTNKSILWYDSSDGWRTYSDATNSVMLVPEPPHEVVLTWEIDTVNGTYRFFVNHTLRSSYEGPVPSFAATDRWTLGMDWDGTTPTDGNNMDVYEVLVWNRVLTDYERTVAIDRSAYDHDVPVEIIIDEDVVEPDAPEIQVWTPAESDVACWIDISNSDYLQLSGSNITGATDRSGNGNDADIEGPGTVILGSINGIQAAQHNSADTGLRVPNQGYTDIFWVQNTSDTSYVNFTSDDGNDWFFRAQDGSALSTVSSQSGSPVLWVDGQQAFFSDQNAVHDSLAGASIAHASNLDLSTWLDIRIFQFGAFEPAFSYEGEWGEMLFFLEPLSNPDRQKVEGYLAHKWGLTANLPVDHPYKTEPPLAAGYVDWTPIDSGAWYDASTDSNLLLFGSEVTGMRDLTGNARTISTVNSGVLTRDVTINGVQAISFPTPETTRALSVANFFPVSMFAVQETVDLNYALLSQGSFSYLGIAQSGSADQLNSNATLGGITVDGTLVDPLSRDSLYTSLDGVPRQLHAFDINLSWYNSAFNPYHYPTAPWQYSGKLGEMVFYTVTPDDTTVKKVEGYLGHKWKITPSLPAEHPYKNRKPLVTGDIPSFINVAAYEADRGIAVNDNAPVPQWDPVIGAVPLLQANGANQPTFRASAAYSKLPSVQFAGSHYMDALLGNIGAGNTVIVVGEKTANGVQHTWFDTPNPAARNHLFIEIGNTWSLFAGSVIADATETSPQVGDLHMVACVFDGAESFLRVDRDNYTLNANPGTADMQDLRIGMNVNVAYGGHFYLHAIYVTDLVLSNAQLNEIYTYCRRKWRTP